MFTNLRTIYTAGIFAGLLLPQVSCRKMLTVPEPDNSITTTQVFSTNDQALSAIAGIYGGMIGDALGFSNGYTTLLNGLSADELIVPAGRDVNLVALNSNHLIYLNSYTTSLWSSAYTTIYGANSVIEGIAASVNSAMTDSMRNELTGEAKFVRAFAYFYLVNCFGDVPLALTVDFNKTRNMARTPTAQVYQQIIQDLKDAQSLLPADFSAAGPAGERIRPNKYAATALLARALLFTKDYAGAATQASTVISNTSLFTLVSDLNSVFLANSTEAIWQLKQNPNDIVVHNATLEGYTIIPNPFNTGVSTYNLTDQLLSAFEPGDGRRTAWLSSTNNSYMNPSPPTTTWFPYKYKTGSYNAVSGAQPTEYYTVFRLAEMYLIRAEAEANGATGGTAAAIGDLNIIRTRAGLAGLSTALGQSDVIAAVAHERQIELFAEWGHRWMDLKRTNQAHNVLSAISQKQPWAGDYQLVYPIPPNEILNDHYLLQNTGY